MLLSIRKPSILSLSFIFLQVIFFECAGRKIKNGNHSNYLDGKSHETLLTRKYFIRHHYNDHISSENLGIDYSNERVMQPEAIEPEQQKIASPQLLPPESNKKSESTDTENSNEKLNEPEQVPISEPEYDRETKSSDTEDSIEKPSPAELEPLPETEPNKDPDTADTNDRNAKLTDPELLQLDLNKKTENIDTEDGTEKPAEHKIDLKLEPNTYPESNNEKQVESELKNTQGPKLEPSESPEMSKLNNKRPEMEGKIVGGQYANIKNMPHSVFLSVSCDGEWICGSSIITQSILLTAAHCLEGCIKNFKIEAYAGSANLDNVNTLRKARSIKIHENYDDRTVSSDIGLVRLNGNLPLGSNIARVILRPSFPRRSQGVVAGWGVINDQGRDTVKLKRVEQTVQSPDNCGKLSLLRGMMCGYSGVKDNHPAAGDSGSAFITNGFQQIGLVSFRGRTNNDIIVYTNVSYYYPWIMEKSSYLICGNQGK